MPIKFQPSATWSDQKQGPGAFLRDEEEPELRQSQDPTGLLRPQPFREQGLQGLLVRWRRRLSFAANL
jgi:hypothetical protein